MKKYLLGFCLLFVLLGTSKVGAATLAELQALLLTLQAQLNALQSAQGGTTTGGTTTTVGSSAFCYNFDSNLKYGDDDVDNVGPSDAIQALQNVLEREGFVVNVSERKAGAVFQDSTAAAVVGFQEKYASEILAPVGLTHGTGFVGASTRAKLNALYGCRTAVPKPPTTSASTPVSLKLVSNVTGNTGSIVSASITGYPSNNLISYWKLTISCGAGVIVSNYQGNNACGAEYRYYNQNMGNTGNDYPMITSFGLRNNSSSQQNVVLSLIAYDQNNKNIGGDKNGVVLAGSNTIPNGPSSPTISVDRSTIQSGELVRLKLGKYPSTAQYWTLGVNCPAGVSVIQKGIEGCTKIGSPGLFGITHSSAPEDWGVTIKNNSGSTQTVNFSITANNSDGSGIGGPNDSASVTVYPSVTQATSLPKLVLSSDFYDVNYTIGGTVADPTTINLSNPSTNNQSINFEISNSNQPSWLQAAFTKGNITIVPGGNTGIALYINPTMLNVGTYTYDLNLVGNFSNSPAKIHITLNVLQAINTGDFNSNPLTNDEKTTSYDYPNQSCSYYQNYYNAGSVSVGRGLVYSNALAQCSSGSVPSDQSFRAYSCSTPSSNISRVTYAYKCNPALNTSVDKTTTYDYDGGLCSLYTNTYAAPGSVNVGNGPVYSNSQAICGSSMVPDTSSYRVSACSPYEKPTNGAHVTYSFKCNTTVGSAVTPTNYANAFDTLTSLKTLLLELSQSLGR